MTSVNLYIKRSSTLNVCKRENIVCPPVRRDNPRALASGSLTIQADKPYYLGTVRQGCSKTENYVPMWFIKLVILYKVKG